MNNYYSFELSNNEFNYLIIATSYENPINSFLCNSIPFLNNGMIAFDLTIINGKGSNRYAFAKVENHRINPSTIKVSADIDLEISNISNKYFLDNIDLIERSVLPKVLKRLLIDELRLSTNIRKQYT